MCYDGTQGSRTHQAHRLDPHCWGAVGLASAFHRSPRKEEMGRRNFQSRTKYSRPGDVTVATQSPVRSYRDPDSLQATWGSSPSLGVRASRPCRATAMSMACNKSIIAQVFGSETARSTNCPDYSAIRPECFLLGDTIKARVSVSYASGRRRRVITTRTKSTSILEKTRIIYRLMSGDIK